MNANCDTYYFIAFQGASRTFLLRKIYLPFLLREIYLPFLLHEFVHLGKVD